jgi:hypothetical protein
MSRFPVAFRPPAFASRSSDSRRGIRPPSRSAYRPNSAGPRRGYRVPHARATTGLGALSTPRTTVLIPTEDRPQPTSAAPPRPVLTPRYNIPSSRAPSYEASPRVQAIHPPDLPLACSPQMEREPLGFPPSFEPRWPGARRRTSRRGRAIEHGPETTLTTSVEPPILRVYSYACDLASQRSRRKCRERSWSCVLPNRSPLWERSHKGDHGNSGLMSGRLRSPRIKRCQGLGWGT